MLNVGAPFTPQLVPVGHVAIDPPSAFISNKYGMLIIGLLIDNTGSVTLNIKKLGFIPYAYNPGLKLTTAKTIQQAHEYGCKVIVWTVNRENDMKKLINWGVDGLITDYPNVAIKHR